MIYLIYQIRLPIVIGEPEWCLMAHTIINPLTIANFIYTRPVGNS